MALSGGLSQFSEGSEDQEGNRNRGLGSGPGTQRTAPERAAVTAHATHHLISRAPGTLPASRRSAPVRTARVARSWGVSSALRHKCDPGLEREGFSWAASPGLKGHAQRLWEEDPSVEGLCSRGFDAGGAAVLEGMNVCHTLHMTFGSSHVVPRQLACGREGHSGHSWAACGATFIAMIGHNFS